MRSVRVGNRLYIDQLAYGLVHDRTDHSPEYCLKWNASCKHFISRYGRKIRPNINIRDPRPCSGDNVRGSSHYAPIRLTSILVMNVRIAADRKVRILGKFCRPKIEHLHNIGRTMGGLISDELIGLCAAARALAICSQNPEPVRGTSAFGH